MANLYRIDGVLWKDNGASYTPTPICPNHRLEMDAWTYDQGPSHFRKYKLLHCGECSDEYPIPREYNDQLIYVQRKISSSILKDFKVIDFDGEAMPLSEGKDSDDDHFVIAKLVDTKVGKRVVVYVGEKGLTEKTQIFIEPDIKRLAFDQKDVHPSDVFLKLEAQFSDGTKHTIEKDEQS